MREISIGIDIGGTNSKFGFVDQQGKCLYRESIATHQAATAEDFVARLAQHIKNALQKFPEKLSVRGVGIGAPNGNALRGTIEFAPNLPWPGIIPLAKLMDKFFHPVYVDNDANVAALGEMLYGSARGFKDFILITLGTGVGSGFVCNGKLLHGHDSFAGELGHMIIEQNGRPCACGRRGCLEGYASVSGLVTTTKELLAKNSDPSTLRKNKITGEHIHQAAMQGDKIAMAAFAKTGEYLGFALANAVAITNPQALILFGGLSQAGELLLQPTHKALENNLLKIYQGKIQLLISQLPQADAAILGTSSLVCKFN